MWRHTLSVSAEKPALLLITDNYCMYTPRRVNTETLKNGGEIENGEGLAAYFQLVCVTAGIKSGYDCHLTMTESEI